MYEEIIYNEFFKVNKRTYKEGIKWYSKARYICRSISEEYNVPLFKVVGVLSALSPRNKWQRNIEDTRSILKYGDKATVATFNNNKEKALRILSCKGEKEVVKLLSSPKIFSFYNNIMYDNDHLTVDVWAARLVREEKITNKKYLQIREAYQNIAIILNLQPKQLQAILWTHIRGSYVYN